MELAQGLTKIAFCGAKFKIYWSNQSRRNIQHSDMFWGAIPKRVAFLRVSQSTAYRSRSNRDMTSKTIEEERR